MSATDFSRLPLPAALLATLEQLGYRQMTPIQAQSLPAMLDGRDVIARARTGSGKTAAFALALLARLQVERFCVQALVVCPTRELADQVAGEIRRLARGIHNIKVLTLCGGESASRQRESLQHGAHIIVGTPGRLLDHLQKQRLDCRALHTLVLDEADRMLDMGFLPDIEALLALLPAARQSLLFSATFPPAIEALASELLQQPQLIEATDSDTPETIEQQFYRVDDTQRLDACLRLLYCQRPQAAVIFCNTRSETAELARQLQQHGIDALALHGDMEQRDRDQALMQLANHSVVVLVATDVAARGLDISALDLVINYRMARDRETHTHRIGRTGRAGEQGLACTLVDADEQHRLALLLEQDIEPLPLPEAPARAEPLQAAMVTLQMDGGKKQKIRPADILGALTANPAIDGSQIGKIRVLPLSVTVAVRREIATVALATLQQQPVKGRMRRVRRLRH